MSARAQFDPKNPQKNCGYGRLAGHHMRGYILPTGSFLPGSQVCFRPAFGATGGDSLNGGLGNAHVQSGAAALLFSGFGWFPYPFALAFLPAPLTGGLPSPCDCAGGPGEGPANRLRTGVGDAASRPVPPGVPGRAAQVRFFLALPHPHPGLRGHTPG